MYKMQGVKWMLKYVEIVISPSRSQPLFVIEMLKNDSVLGPKVGVPAREVGSLRPQNHANQ